jgi:predicted enzyme related to lactoylglutathione lyase
MSLAAIRIFATDVPAAPRFCAEVVGLRQVAGSSPNVALFGTSSPQIIVEAVGAGDDGEGLAGRFAGISSATGNADALHAELSAAGVATSGVPEGQPWGGILLHADDPSWNTITLVQLPQPVAG